MAKPALVGGAGLEARLDAAAPPEGAAWITAARKGARERLLKLGLPSRRDEYWRFTPPNALTEPEPRASEAFEVDAPIFSDRDRVHLVFVDGVFDAEASDALDLDEVVIERLETARSSDIHWASDVFGVLEERGQAHVDRPLAALNTALAADGMVIHVTGTPAKPIHIAYKQSAPNSDVVLHHCIKLDAGAELTLLETGTAGARANTCLEVEIADRAALHHIRPQGRAPGRHGAHHVFARLGAEATFKSFTLAFDGRLSRNESVVELLGDDAVVHLAGAFLGDGEDGKVHHDDTVFITHDAVNCESRQVFKKVLRAGSVGTFQGKILVKPGAQKTDGYQISQSLLLDDDAQFLAKPELEIYADDVACSHGSTSGAIDETALFYLRSRGVPLAEAQNLMVLAFLAEAIDEIEDEGLGGAVLDRLTAWLERYRGRRA
ncbi:MAG: SufD family Fe-S cluster assembly protein [Pseudomonadota bacterium]